MMNASTTLPESRADRLYQARGWASGDRDGVGQPARLPFALASNAYPTSALRKDIGFNSVEDRAGWHIGRSGLPGENQGLARSFGRADATGMRSCVAGRIR